MSLLLLCFCCHGEAGVGNVVATSPVVFPELLSSDHTVLMTNAEFRCTQGRRLIFRNAAAYQTFDSAVLDAGVLDRLGLSLDRLQAAQDRMDDLRAQYAAAELAQARAYAALQASLSNQTNAVVPAMAPAPNVSSHNMSHNVSHNRTAHLANGVSFRGGMLGGRNSGKNNDGKNQVVFIGPPTVGEEIALKNLRARLQKSHHAGN